MSPRVKHSMVWNRKPLSRLVLPLCSALILASCASEATNPFDSARRRQVNARWAFYRVQFEVRCRDCTITWNVGTEGGTVDNDGPWRLSVDAYPYAGDNSASLSAAPDLEDGVVSWIRIRVNGKVVAEERSGYTGVVSDSGARQVLTASTPIPPIEG